MFGRTHTVPSTGKFSRLLRRAFRGSNHSPHFTSSQDYWEQRYALGGHSGAGSYRKFAEFKAEVLNRFVSKQAIESVIEFGCGDGNQLLLAEYPRYLGIDVSPTAVDLCRELFRSDDTKEFLPLSDYAQESADLTLSLDVIYHLVEDEVFTEYMRTLFAAAQRYVIIYASNFDDPERQVGPHVRHRKFTRWVESELPQWQLQEHIPNKYPYRGNYKKGSFADFYVYEKA
ncbi:bifunctional 2-polyprenyl-6-hydroxyphenol methylase/3-demethylubiquinol 3-O-methyltransferase UbiG [Marinimicrobium sp. ABcell2]|uniref:class I SAM-dependent methyltransferase n=1 Tax=Marinimicrobium sp. ABcell2 TaxID=3069751 RepID=UPI0027AEA62B|nr:class I SAM-dependent methyltransferase [Marinimicrobium sp. ABcell2]MDQ2075105.1 class I SAM-dependent methyltransferase [Marinimicrobium sp. ABcell2]